MTSKQPRSILFLLRRIWRHLNIRRRFQLLLLLFAMLASGLAELISLSAVLPFLAMLSNPEQVWNMPPIQSIALRFGLSQPQHLVVPITVAFSISAILAAMTRLINLWLNGRLTASVGSDLSCEAYKRTLYQPYQVHVRRNSSMLISVMTRHISLTVAALETVLQILSAIVVATFLLFGLLYVDWQVALSTAALFGIAYVLLAIISHRQLLHNGERISSANNQRVQALQEGLGAIRDVLLDGSQSTYLDLYRHSDRPQRIFESRNRFLSSFPRFALEATGLVAIALLGGLLVIQRGSGAAVIPLLGALALGAQRLLPALQQIYSGWAALNSWRPSLALVIEMLDQPLPEAKFVIKPFVMKKNICLEGVHFRYSSELPEVLQTLDLEIQKGQRVGLIGSTGSGKSTLLDLLMGLLPPSRGKFLIDGIDLYAPANNQLLIEWRASVAHVPQNIYLSDSSIAENIAFGVPRDKIDFARVKRAAEQAQIADFIETSLEGYDSLVGERGIRLSGGQRQRIGIARALYKQASVIILDEATSALDTETEKAVMEAVDGLSRNLTLVIVAHRLSTIEGCDRVILLSNGTIQSDGPPDNSL